MSQLTRFPCPGALLMQTAIFSSHLTWEKYIDELRELVEPLSEATRRRIVGANVAQVYGL